MKSSYLYTIIFMLVISVFFTLLLAGANSFYKPIIEENELLAERSAILYVFNLEQNGTSDEVLKRFDDNVKETEVSGIKLFEYTTKGKTIAYAVPFTGAGLWGSISGYMGVSPELDKITGLVFTNQSETPGLGGRIDELQYKEQFRGITIDAGSSLAYGEDGGGQIDAITGATLTSNAVLKILNELLTETISSLEVA